MSGLTLALAVALAVALGLGLGLGLALALALALTPTFPDPTPTWLTWLRKIVVSGSELEITSTKLGSHIGPQRGHGEQEENEEDGLAPQVVHRVGTLIAGVRARLRRSAARYDDGDGPAERGEPHLKRADAREGARIVDQVITEDVSALAARSRRDAAPAAVAVVALPRVELGVGLGEGGHYPEHARREVSHVEHHEQQFGDGNGGVRHRDPRRPALYDFRAAHQP
eukprot:scaffold10356_cov61-Phaeocystis_antarctica.AAC.3